MGIFTVSINIFLSKIVIICQYRYAHIMGIYLLIRVRVMESLLRLCYLVLLLGAVAYANITGVVYKELPISATHNSSTKEGSFAKNSYGKMDSNEPGIGGITVKGVDASGHTAIATTATDGTYTLTGLSGKVRVEFSGYLSKYFESMDGSNKNASVRFVNDGDSVNFGLYDPQEYTYNENPPIQTVLYFLTNSEDDKANYPTFTLNQYTENSGNNADWNQDNNLINPNATHFLKMKDTGAVWGLGYDPLSSYLYAAAFLKRHTALAKGLDTLYVIDFNKANPSASTLKGSLSLQGKAGLDFGTVSGHDDSWHDDDAFKKVGKVGIGDIDVDRVHRKLWGVSLNDKKLFSLDLKVGSLPDTSTLKAYDIAGKSGIPDCNGSQEDLRPWALEFHEGKGYLGMVCSAETSRDDKDLHAYVVSFDPNNPTSFTPVLDFSMNYAYADYSQDQNHYHFWSSDWAKDNSMYYGDGDKKYLWNQPLLSDIEFDKNGNIYVSFLNRFGHQVGWMAPKPDGSDNLMRTSGGSDLILACLKSDGTYELEGDGVCPTNEADKNDANKKHAYGLAGAKEFILDRAADGQQEGSLGGVALVPGMEEIINSTANPHPNPEGLDDEDYYDAGGISHYRLYNNDGSMSGDNVNYYTHYGKEGNPSGFDKTAGMGDVELILDPAPVEIGNRVWDDTNADGIQDAGEAGIDGIKVQLICGGNKVAEATTENGGYYIFSNDPNGTSTTSHIYNIAELQPNNPNKCKVVIPNVSTQLAGKNASPAAAGDDKQIDSDGVKSGDNDEATIASTDIANAGANNHTYDFGFSKPQKACIGDYVWYDDNQDGIQDDSEKPVPNITVKLLKDGADFNTTTTDDNGIYSFCNLDDGTYSIQFDLSTLPTGYIVTKQDAGSDDTKDSDANENDGKTTSTSLKAGDNNTTFDMGIYKPKAHVDLEKHTNGVDADDAADAPYIKVGDTVTWEYNVTNDGEEKLINVVVHDDTENKDVSCPKTELAAGESMVCTLTATAVAGPYENTAQVNAKGSDSATPVKDTDPSHYYGSDPKIDIEKFTDDNNGKPQQADNESDADVPTLYVGKSVKWRYIVKNTGNVKLTDIKVTDDVEGAVSCPNTELDVNATMTCTKEGTVKEGKYANEATVEGTPPTGANDKVTDKDPSHYNGIEPACIGDTIWSDTNGDGIQDSGESGVKGAKVELFDDANKAVTDVDGNAKSAITTADDGKYKFCRLAPGKYHIVVTPPSGYVISPKDKGGDDAKDSDIDPTTGKTVDTQLDAGENDMTWDGGVYKPACIGDYVWLDKNSNGIQDSGESGLANVKVELFKADNTKVAEMNTDANGKYHFCKLVPGNYYVKVTPPAGDKISPKDKGADDSKDSDIDPTTGKTEPTTLDAGEDDTSWDGAIYQPACLGDYVWDDKNANGIQDAGESGISGVTVELYAKDGTTKLKSMETNSTGGYEFCDLTPGDYHIKVIKPTGYYTSPKDKGADDAKDSDIDPTDGTTPDTNIESGERDETLDAGLFKPACIGDYIWEDKNANGIQDANERAVAGVKVELFKKGSTQAVVDADGKTVNYQVTADDGKYLFCQLVPGEYHIKVTTPDAYYVTKKEQGTDKAKDSDLDPTFNAKVGTTKDTMLDSGEKDLTWDGGIFRPACIGDYIWEDKNANGIQDAGESGVAGVELNLVDGNGAAVKNINGDTVAPITTKDDGAYKFCQLVPGEYQVKVTKLPDNYYITRDNVGDDSKDSDISSFLATSGNMPKTTLDSGEKDYTFDGGVFQPACIGDYVWKDKNVNGLQDDDEEPIAGVKVQVVSSTGADVTDVFGKAVTELQTDENGLYHQCNLVPGEYKVKFNAQPDSNGAPYISTKQVDDEAKGSDIPEFKEQYGESQTVMLQSGDDYRDIDAGYIQEICLGDYVWFDENLNGVQDKNEPGVIDIPVSITDANGNSVTDVYGNRVNITKTDKKGYYKFCHLLPAQDYIIKFKVPDSYHPTLKDKGSDIKDSDANKDGTIYVKHPVRDDLTLDMGIYCDCDDYIVHPDEYHELKMPALNILGLLAMLTAVFILVRREN